MMEAIQFCRQTKHRSETYIGKPLTDKRRDHVEHEMGNHQEI